MWIVISILIVVLVVLGFISKKYPEVIKEFPKGIERVLVLLFPLILLVILGFLMWFEANNVGKVMGEIYKQDTAVIGLFAILAVSMICVMVFPHLVIQIVEDSTITFIEWVKVILIVFVTLICHIYFLFQAHEVYVISGPTKAIFTLLEGQARYNQQIMYSILTVIVEVLIGFASFDESLLKKKVTKPSSSTTSTPAPSPGSTAPSVIDQIAAKIATINSTITNPKQFITGKIQALGLDETKVLNNITDPGVQHYLSILATMPSGYNIANTINKIKK